MTDPTVRQEITELFAGQGWPDGGDALLGRSLGPRSLTRGRERMEAALGPVWYRRALAPADPARPAGAGAVRAGQALTGSLGSGHWLYQCRLGGLSSLNACSGGGA
jgi:hypothetical protein